MEMDGTERDETESAERREEERRYLNEPQN
jgi:hypothetical protein